MSKHPLGDPGASHAFPVTDVPVCVRSRYVASFPTVPLHAPVTFAFVVVAPEDDVVMPLLPPLLPPLPPLDADDVAAPLDEEPFPEDEDDADEADEVESSSPPHATTPVMNRTATVEYRRMEIG